MLKWVPELGVKLQPRFAAAADLLALYANTDTFVKLRGYNKFKSSPVDVYARELANTVPHQLIPPATCTASTGDYRIAMKGDKINFYDPEDAVASVSI